MKTKLKQTNGITLIALIITIIILLILAMVTIRILMNQGIIEHAQNATAAYNDAQNNETEYLTYAEGEMDKYGGGRNSNAATGEDLDLLRKYFLGVKDNGDVNEEGQSFMNVANQNEAEDSLQYTFKTNSVIADEGNLPQFLNMMIVNAKEYNMIVKYKSAAYKVVTDEALNTKQVELIYTENKTSKEGQEVNYSIDGISEKTKWTVLYDNGETVEIVSNNCIGELLLGAKDEKAKNEVPDGRGGTMEESRESIGKAVYSYNNMVKRLNDYCKDVVTNPTAKRIRSIGSDPMNPYSDTEEYYTANTSNWNIEYNNKAKNEDNKADDDYVRMLYYEIAIADLPYWLASRSIYEAPNYIGFSHRFVMPGNGSGFEGAGWTYTSWIVTSEGADLDRSGDYRLGVRACVTVNKSDVGL